MNIRRLLAAALFSLEVVMTGTSAALAADGSAAPGPAAPASAPSELNSAPMAAVSLAESSPEAASLYRFVVQPHPEPTRTQLLLGGLLAAIFLIRNRFRDS